MSNNVFSSSVALSLRDAQADMRVGYRCGAPGVAVSGAVWLVAGGVALGVSHQAAVWALLIGGAMIHPLGMLLARLTGARGSHTPGNPLASLAGEGTVWLLAGIVIAYGLHLLRLEWFFPAMLLVIGGRYFTFQTLYGLRTYWVLGGLLCALGMALVVTSAPVPVAALSGGALEVVFALWLYRRSKG